MVSTSVTATAPVSTGTSAGISTAARFLQKLKGKGLSGGLQTIMCIPEFKKVPGAFALKYNRSAEKVAGLNWTSGLLETFKSLPKAAQWLIVPTAIAGAAVGLGPIGATMATVAGFALPMGISSLFEKLFQHEEEVIAQACKEKGIDITKDDIPDIRKPGGVLT